MIVAVGLVIGVIDPTTPKGACSVSIIPPSPADQRLEVPARGRVATRMFLRTLSSLPNLCLLMRQGEVLALTITAGSNHTAVRIAVPKA
jgi:hypothetical protein